MWNNPNLNIGYIYQKKSWGSSWSLSLLLTFIATKESCTYCSKSKYPHKNREAIFYRRSVESWVAKAETARFPDVEIIGRRWSGRKSDQTISRPTHEYQNVNPQSLIICVFAVIQECISVPLAKHKQIASLEDMQAWTDWLTDLITRARDTWHACTSGSKLSGGELLMIPIWNMENLG